MRDATNDCANREISAFTADGDARRGGTDCGTPTKRLTDQTVGPDAHQLSSRGTNSECGKGDNGTTVDDLCVKAL